MTVDDLLKILDQIIVLFPGLALAPLTVPLSVDIVADLHDRADRADLAIVLNDQLTPTTNTRHVSSGGHLSVEVDWDDQFS